MMAGACECEHIDHFDDGPAHPYGKAKATRKIKTTWDTLAFCDDCLKAGHHDC